MQKHLSSLQYWHLFSIVLAALVFGTGVFYWLTIHWNRYWPYNPGFVFPPPLPCFMFRVVNLVFHRWWSGEFQNHRVHQGDNTAVESPSIKCNIIVEFLIILTLYWWSVRKITVLNASERKYVCPSRDQFLVVSDQNLANHFSWLWDKPISWCFIGDVLSESNKWENLASANLKMWKVQDMESWRHIGRVTHIFLL